MSDINNTLTLLNDESKFLNINMGSPQLRAELRKLGLPHS